MKGKISEIFESIQGEGLYAGQRHLFIRFFGCNLGCRFCDTRLDFYREYLAQELLREVKSFDGFYQAVSFTGGEPLLQAEFLKEISGIIPGGEYKKYLETNGTLPDELERVIDNFDVVAMDLKLPSSTGAGDFWQEHRRFLSIASSKEVFLKCVICLSTQEEDLRKAIALIKENDASAVLTLQPNSFEEGAALSQKLENFRSLCENEGVTACVIAQMHKRMGVK